MGTGFTWDTQDRSSDIAAAERTWEQAANMLGNPELDLGRSRRADLHAGF
jgi:cob(I)alamin adenosyltransferase